MAIRKRTNREGTVWQIDYYDPKGKRVMKCFPLKKDAEAYLGKVLAAKKEGRYQDVFDVKRETQITFNELTDRYEENFATQNFFKSFKLYALRTFRQAFGDMQLSEITYLDLETFRNRRKATPTMKGTPRADATVNREMATLKHMMGKAVDWGLMEASPFKKGKKLLFRENNCRLRFLTETEIEALLNACVPHLKPIVEAAIHTGMRRGEILSLKWEQIRNGLIYLTKTKSGKARQIPINDRLGQLLKELRQRNQLKSQYVFCGPDWKRLYWVSTSFNTACKKVGLEDFRFHDLRHTFASQLVMKGASLKAVQELLGHADLKMTMRYAHLTQEHLRDSVNLLNSLSNGKEIVNIPPQEGKAN